MPQTLPQNAAPRPTQDFSLLFDRLAGAPLDDTGRELVSRVLADSVLWQNFPPDAVQRLALIAQQHGLINESLTLLEWQVTQPSAPASAWRLLFETLHMLGRREDCVRLRARAADLLPAHELAAWPEVPGPATTENADDTQAGDEPFLHMRREQEDIQLFMRLFRGRDDAFARQWAEREQDRQGYMPVHRPLGPADIAEHLAGSRTYGIYLLDQANMVHTGVIDVDLKKELRPPEILQKNRDAVRRESVYLHQRLMERAKEHGMTCISEVSGGKGYHYWFPVADPVLAAAMRRALFVLAAGLQEDVSCFALEIFPKQDQVQGKGFGNLVKLPLGIHRATGKPSWLVLAKDRQRESQFAYLRTITASPAEALLRVAGRHQTAQVLVHPRHARWAEEFPELAELENRCAMLGQIMAGLRSSRTLSIREEKILLGTLAHLPRGRLLLHHLCAGLPEYNRPLTDYKISRVRGAVLGCKRIHSLMTDSVADLPCRFAGEGYAHPLRHIEGFAQAEQPAEKVENLKDALLCLRTAILQVERFL